MSVVLLTESGNYVPVIFRCSVCLLCLRFEELAFHNHIKTSSPEEENIKIHSDFLKNLEKNVNKRVNCFKIIVSLTKSLIIDENSDDSAKATKLIDKFESKKKQYEEILRRNIFSLKHVKFIQKQLISLNLIVKYTVYQDPKQFLDQQFLVKSIKSISSPKDLLIYSEHNRDLKLIPRRISIDQVVFAYNSFYVIDLINCFMIFDTKSSSVHSMIYYRLNKLICSTENFSHLSFITKENYLINWDIESRFTVFEIHLGFNISFRGLSYTKDENNLIFADNLNFIYIVCLMDQSIKISAIFEKKYNFGFLMQSNLKNVIVVYENQIYLCDLKKVKILLSIKLKQKIVHDLVFLVDDDHFIYKDSKSINLFSLKKQKAIKSFKTTATNFYIDLKRTCVITNHNDFFDISSLKVAKKLDSLDNDIKNDIHFRYFEFQFEDLYSSKIFTYSKVQLGLITHLYSNYQKAALIYENNRISLFDYKTKNSKEFYISYFQYDIIKFSNTLKYIFLGDQISNEIFAWNFEKNSFEYYQKLTGLQSATQFKIISERNLLIIGKDSFISIFKNLPKIPINFNNSNFICAANKKSIKPIVVCGITNSLFQLDITDPCIILKKINSVSDMSMIHIFNSQDKILFVTLKTIYILSSNFYTKTAQNTFNSVEDLSFYSSDMNGILKKNNDLIIFNYNSEPSIYRLTIEIENMKLFHFNICKGKILILSFILENSEGFYSLYDKIYKDFKNLSGKHQYFVPNSLNFDYYHKRNSHFSYSYMIKLNQEIRDNYLRNLTNSKDLFYIIFPKAIIRVKTEAIEVLHIKGKPYKFSIDSSNHQNIISLAKNVLIDIVEDKFFLLNLSNFQIYIHNFEKEYQLFIYELNPFNASDLNPLSIYDVIFLGISNKVILVFQNKLIVCSNFLEIWYIIEEVDSFYISRDEKFIISVIGQEIYLYLLNNHESIRLRINESVWKIIWIEMKNNNGDYNAYFLADCLVEKIVISNKMIDRNS